MSFGWLLFVCLLGLGCRYFIQLIHQSENHAYTKTMCVTITSHHKIHSFNNKTKPPHLTPSTPTASESTLSLKPQKCLNMFKTQLQKFGWETNFLTCSNKIIKRQTCEDCFCFWVSWWLGELFMLFLFHLSPKLCFSQIL